jgi:hypothetical protein
MTTRIITMVIIKIKSCEVGLTIRSSSQFLRKNKNIKNFLKNFENLKLKIKKKQSFKN